MIFLDIGGLGPQSGSGLQIVKRKAKSEKRIKMYSEKKAMKEMRGRQGVVCNTQSVVPTHKHTVLGQTSQPKMAVRGMVRPWANFGGEARWFGKGTGGHCNWTEGRG